MRKGEAFFCACESFTCALKNASPLQVARDVGYRTRCFLPHAFKHRLHKIP